MLAIRMQRTGRKGHAQFRLIVQDKRFSPTSGRVVAFLGSYDPHSKSSSLDKEKAAQYLKNGAQPTERVAKILKSEGVKLPDWVQAAQKQKKSVKHPEKLRRNRPAGSDAPKDEAPETKEDAPAELSESPQSNAENDAPVEKAEEKTVEPATEQSEPAAKEDKTSETEAASSAPVAEKE